jgi:hypothetical protein
VTKEEPTDACPGALARFRSLVAEQPALQERLGAIAVPDEFVAEAIAAAADLDIALDEAAVRASLRISPIDVAGFMAPSSSTANSWPPLGWLPARSARTGAEPAFDWIWFGAAPLTAPFHYDEVRRMGFRPFGLMTRVRTDLAALVRGAESETTLPPDGFIFHMSRCGSTLAAQVLAAVPHHIVMSEPEPVDAVVRWAVTSGAPQADQIAALRAVVAALGRNRDGTSTRYFLKLDSWHAFALPLFRAAFPDTPWLFLHREPAEVLVSLRRQPGIQSAPGGLPAALIGFDPAAATSLEDYAGRLFAAMFDRVLATLEGGGGMVIHYPDLVEAMARAIPAHFGFVPGPREALAMAAATTRDAKTPEIDFASDTFAKRAQISPAIAAAVELWLADRYTMLLDRSCRP